MRNAGDAMPGGSASRRHREQTPEQSSPAAGPGGASLFTPAYRVSHAVAGTRPVSQDESGPGSPARPNSRYGRAGDLPGPGYAWADSEPGPPGTGYQQSGYGPGGGGPAWPGDDLAAGYSWAAYDQAAGAWPGSGVAGRGVPPQPRSNAVRGFPPAPGEPLPVYPPGPFAAWNRSPADPAGQEGGSRAGGYSESSRQLAAATITPDDFDTDYSLPAIKDPVPAKAGGDAAGRTAADRTAAGRRPAGGPGQDQPRAPHRGGRAGSKGRTTRTRRKRLSAWLASATAAVIIAAVALILVQTSPGSGAPSAHQNPTSTPGPAGRLHPGAQGHLPVEDRQGDGDHRGVQPEELRPGDQGRGEGRALRVRRPTPREGRADQGDRPGHRHRGGGRQGALPRPGVGRGDGPERTATHQGRPRALRGVHEPADQPHGEHAPEHPHGGRQAGAARLTAD